MAEYQSAVVSYIDILGFKAIIDTSSADDVSSILARFERHSAPYFASGDNIISYVAFSDLIVRIATVTDPKDPDAIVDAIITEASDLAAAQSQLIQRGIAVRGAITNGHIRIVDGKIYGPALVRAHELEKTALQPRIIIDPLVANDLGLSAWIDEPDADADDVPHHVLLLCTYFSRDTDGAIYVDYLRALCELGLDGTAEAYAEAGILFTKHRNAVLRGLEDTDDRVVGKYEWLRRYHNKCVPEGFETLAISERDT